MKSLLLESFSQTGQSGFTPHIAKACLDKQTQLMVQPTIKSSLKPAAVLLPLIDYPSHLSIILTKRTAHLSHHAGQICLPGGRAEKNDNSPVATALRETEEEIGLAPRHVSVLGNLGTYETHSGFLITAIVGLVKSGLQLKLNQTEVAEAFEVPLDFVANLHNYRRKSRSIKGQQCWYYELAYQDKVIWGATAGILVNLANKLGDKS